MEEDNQKGVEREVELLEFALCNEEIDELVAKLELLKVSKESIGFDIDDENELLIHYDKEESAE